MSHFSERLKKIRMERKKENSAWTQEYVADKIGVARVTYTAYERGTKTPPLETVRLIAELFNEDANYFLEVKDSGMAFYGGGKDWTDEEIEFADALIQKLREQKEAKTKTDKKS